MLRKNRRALLGVDMEFDLKSIRFLTPTVATVDAEDFLQLLALLTQLPPTAEGTARSERLLKLAFHGLERSEDH